MHESRETIKTRIEVEPRFPGSHESRETLNQTKQTFPTSSSENQNHNKSNYCKEIKRNSFEPAEVNEKKMKTEAPSKVGRIPIKITGTDIERDDLELGFHLEGEPISIDQTQINLKPHKTTLNHIKPHKATSSHIKPHKVKVVVLSDVPTGSPSNIAQIQDVVNTVGPVPMTFGHGPNTFPHSAAHVLNAYLLPSSIGGEQITEIYAPVAPPIVKCLTFNTGGNLNRGVSIQNTHPKNLFFTPGLTSKSINPVLGLF